MKLDMNQDFSTLNTVLLASRGQPDLDARFRGHRVVQEVRRRLIHAGSVARNVLCKETGLSSLYAYGTPLSISVIPGNPGDEHSLPRLMNVNREFVQVKVEGRPIYVPTSWLFMSSVEQATVIRREARIIKEYLKDEETREGREQSAQELIETIFNSGRNNSSPYIHTLLENEAKANSGSNTWIAVQRMCKTVRDTAIAEGVNFDYNQASLISVAFGNPQIVRESWGRITLRISGFDTSHILHCEACCTNSPNNGPHNKDAHNKPLSIDQEKPVARISLNVVIPKSLLDKTRDEWVSITRRIINNMDRSQRRYDTEITQLLERERELGRALAEAEHHYKEAHQAVIRYREGEGRNGFMRSDAPHSRPLWEDFSHPLVPVALE